MPSTGHLTERDYTADERVAIVEAAGLSACRAMRRSAARRHMLRRVAERRRVLRCVPANVWRYTIGGYQVIKKWLSYRERTLLGATSSPRRRATSPRWCGASPRSC